MTKHIEQLKNAVVAAFGQTLDSPTDYERLSADIEKKTGELISVSTLKRLFGYIKPGTVPRSSTLSVLARYVGYVGWSDFCAGIEKSVPLKDSKKSIWHNPIVYVAAVIICAGIGWYIWSNQKYAQDTFDKQRTVSSVVMPSDSMPTNKQKSERINEQKTEITNEQKYERLLLSFVTISKEKCDSIRACRQNMDIISYKELVDSLYYPFVFTFLKDSIRRQVERVFPDDKLLRTRYGNDIWGQCRDICVELMHEISSEELIEAYNRKK